MFKVIATGKNPNYGQKGEVRFLADNHLFPALEEEWVEQAVECSPYGSKELLERKVNGAERRIEIENQKIKVWMKEIDRLKGKK
jgi:hypothetical protein